MLVFAVFDKKNRLQKIGPKMAFSAKPQWSFWAHFLTRKNRIFPKNNPSGLAEKAVLALISAPRFLSKRRYMG